MINWKVRFKHKPFLIALVSAILIAAQAVGALFGYEITDGTVADIKNAVEPVLYVLVLLGIIVDPTTDGIGDSEQAKTYETPKK
jgi:phi LC3 family holin